MLTLQSKMKACSSKDIFLVTTAAKIEDVLRINNMYEHADLSQEKAVFIISESQGKKRSLVDALLYSIRCGLAHGGLAIHTYKGKKVYIFENNDKRKIRGRIILKEQTLLQWIKIIESGPEEKKQ